MGIRSWFSTGLALLPVRNKRTIVAVFSGLILVSTLGFVGPTTHASAIATNAAELEFHRLLNDLRIPRGLSPLGWDDGLANYARSWSATMAGSYLHHDPNFGNETSQAVPGWQRAGENVGVGGNVGSLHNAFVASSGHFANMIGDFNRVGIGVVASGGNLWVTVRFAKAPNGSGGIGAPFGSFDSVRQNGDGTIHVSGWSIDPDTSAPTPVHMYVNGAVNVGAMANQTRSDVAAAYPAYGSGHGFDFDRGGFQPGTYQVCMYGINNAGQGNNALLGCRNVTVKSLGIPEGSLDSVTHSGPNGQLTLTGWGADTDTGGALAVHVYVDNVYKGQGTANTYRPDVSQVFPKYSANHGFNFSVSGIAAGSHQVCTYLINVGGGNVNPRLPCKTVTVAQDPIGSLDTATAKTGTSLAASNKQVTVVGWAIDPDTASPITVSLVIDGTTVTTATANLTRNDVANVFPAYGSKHGYSVSAVVSVGTHSVCVKANNTAGGTARTLACRTMAI